MKRRRTFSLLFLPFLALALLLSGCASGSGSMARGSNADLLTAEELSQEEYGTLYEAVERLRPRWLTVRGERSMTASSVIAVYLNTAYLGDPETLRQFVPSSVRQVRFVDATMAGATLSLPRGVFVAGAIVVELW